MQSFVSPNTAYETSHHSTVSSSRGIPTIKHTPPNPGHVELGSTISDEERYILSELSIASFLDDFYIPEFKQQILSLGVDDSISAEMESLRSRYKSLSSTTMKPQVAKNTLRQSVDFELDSPSSFLHSSISSGSTFATSPPDKQDLQEMLSYNIKTNDFIPIEQPMNLEYSINPFSEIETHISTHSSPNLYPEFQSDSKMSLIPTETLDFDVPVLASQINNSQDDSYSSDEQDTKYADDDDEDDDEKEEGEGEIEEDDDDIVYNNYISEYDEEDEEDDKNVVPGADTSNKDQKPSGKSKPRLRARYKCTFDGCKYNGSFQSKDYLRRHIREQHTHKREHRCTGAGGWGCQRVFKRPYQLINHWKGVRSLRKCSVPERLLGEHGIKKSASIINDSRPRKRRSVDKTKIEAVSLKV
ncbi:hypothetical protein CANARDRAFT_26807 [[Candida] arabinofermentans NRRL YB-2248]|uniref:C2H2-type domain-containing protein n=1 Tax=[Candida] arabinofermentans NRRL YB-2248 TaxID=983967 RepID=A0A1E4T6M0_9ASCO|nr:hypothetical protein CANARDRAFT_26807 [[Candida] arabinofermentans NRRL YB-2248]